MLLDYAPMFFGDTNATGSKPQSRRQPLLTDSRIIERRDTLRITWSAAQAIQVAATATLTIAPASAHQLNHADRLQAQTAHASACAAVDTLTARSAERRQVGATNQLRASRVASGRVRPPLEILAVILGGSR